MSDQNVSADYNRAFISPDSEGDIKNYRENQPIRQQLSCVGHLALMSLQNPPIFRQTFLRVLARRENVLFNLEVQTAEELAQPLENGFNQLQELITPAIHGNEGPGLPTIVEYLLRAPVFSNNLVVRFFLTEELGFEITYQLTLSLMRENIRFALSLDGPGAPAQEEVSAALYNAQDLDGHERAESYLRSHSSIKIGSPQHGNLIASAFTLLRHNRLIGMDKRTKNYILGHFPPGWIDSQLV